MRINLVYSIVKPDRFSKPVRLVAWCLAIILFSSCKKEIAKNETNNSSLQYFNTGSSDKVSKVERTPDGGFIYCGTNGLGTYNSQGFMMKVDANGNQEWYKTYGGEKYDELRHAIPCSDGGYLATGRTNSIGQGAKDSNFYYMDYFVKVNSKGEEEWSKSFSKTTEGNMLLSSVTESPDHFFYATGYGYGGSNGNGCNILVMKIDLKGNLIYNKQLTAFSTYQPKILQPTWFEVGTNISIGNDGNILIGGVMDHTSASAYLGQYITFLISIKPSGVVNFFYPYYDYQRDLFYIPGFNILLEKYHNVKIVNLNDGFILATIFDPPGGKVGIEIIRTDLNGNVIWEKKYYGLGNSIIDDLVLINNQITVMGSTTYESLNSSFPEAFQYLKPMILKLDIDGNILSTNIIGSENNASIAKSIQVLPNGDYILAGYTSLAELAYDKMFWIKLTKDGEFSKN